MTHANPNWARVDFDTTSRAGAICALQEDNSTYHATNNTQSGNASVSFSWFGTGAPGETSSVPSSRTSAHQALGSGAALPQMYGMSLSRALGHLVMHVRSFVLSCI